jgi:hypothetical protein
MVKMGRAAMRALCHPSTSPRILGGLPFAGIPGKWKLVLLLSSRRNTA